MDRWTGVLKVPVYPTGSAYCRIAASLCVSPLSKALVVPTANAIFFNGDRVEGTGNPVIERLSDIQNIAEILVSKLGASINAWVIEASTFNGPFALYKEFIPSLNMWGEPQSYKPDGFPASTSVISLLSSFLEESARNSTQEECHGTSTSYCHPRTLLFGFSKGGVVLNQLVTELGFKDLKYIGDVGLKICGYHIIPTSIKGFLDSISEIHYVDVGLNSPGAYITDDVTIKRIAEGIVQRDMGLRFVLHGTPRQWSDRRRTWICDEKDKFRVLLECEGRNSGGKLQVCEKLYFADTSPDLQMHFAIIEQLNLS